MESIFAKRFSKLFTKEVGSHGFNRLKALTKNIKRDSKSAKYFDTLSSVLNSKKNNSVIHYAEFGSKKKPSIGMTFLEHLDINPGVKREEDMIAAAHLYLNKIPTQTISSKGVQFTIGSHVIQRLMERHPNVENFEFDKAFDIVRQELQYVPIYSSVIEMFLSLGTSTNKLPKVLMEGKYPVIFPIPSEHGMFISHVNRGIPSLRTFLSINELNENKKKLREKMIELTSKYRFVNFPYHIQKTFEFENARNWMFIFHYVSALFYDFKEIFIEVLPDCLNEGFLEGQKKQIIEKLLGYTNQFPIKFTEEELQERNSKLKKALEEKTDLAFLRKWLIQINQISQKKEFLL